MSKLLKSLLLSSTFALAACGGQKQDRVEITLDNGTKVTNPTGIHTGVILDQYDDRYMDITAFAKQTCETLHSVSTKAEQSCTVNIRDIRSNLKENRGVVTAECGTSLLGQKSCTIKSAYKPS